MSVKRVDCDKTEEKSVQIFIPYERSYSLVSHKKNGWWGDPIPDILGHSDRVGAMLDARFSLLYFCQSLETLQRGLSAIAELHVLVNFYKTSSN